MKIQEVLQSQPGSFFRCDKCIPGEYYELRKHFLYSRELGSTRYDHVNLCREILDREFYPIAKPEDANQTITRVPLTKEMLADVWRQVQALYPNHEYKYLDFKASGKLELGFSSVYDILDPCEYGGEITIPINNPAKT